MLISFRDMKAVSSKYYGVFLLLAGTVALLVLFAIVFAIDGILPTPLKIADEKKHPDDFIAERAQEDLILLTAHGPRVVGSEENEILAVEFLKKQISAIILNAHSNHQIDFDIQLSSGAFLLGANSIVINTYSNIQNVIVRVSSKNDSKRGILINAHFDSVPTSPGGSDDGINCAIMLEVLRKITKSPIRPEHNVIFLFNGAEETGLQGSHSFVSQHKWAKEATVVVNLDSAGHGGKSVLFQTSPGRTWLSTHYNKVSHPYGQAVAEEIFQNNLIPSDTDYRIFRDFGGIIGYDMAFARNGYRYHTKYDDFEHIPLGSYQHVGQNVLELVKSLSNAPELKENGKETTEKIIYYDYIGLFMISYSETMSLIMNLVTAAMSLAVFIYFVIKFKSDFPKNSVIYVSLLFTTFIIGWGVSAGFLLVVAVVLDKIQYTMSWYKNPWILFGLYSAPAVAFSCGSLILFNRYNRKSDINIRTQLQLHAMRIIWTVLMLLGTLANIRSTYVMLLPVLFQTLIFIVIYITNLQYSIKRWSICYLIANILPTMFLMYLSLLMLTLFIPISGRSDVDKNPEITVSLITLTATIMVTSAFVPFVTAVKKTLIFLLFLCLFFVVAIILIFTPLAFPYTGNPDGPAPQRFIIHNTIQTIHNETGHVIKRDSGFVMFSYDRNSLYRIRSYVPQLENKKPWEEDCKKYISCGLPFVTLSKTDAITWINASQPEITVAHVDLKYTKKQINETLVQYDVSITGPARRVIFISPIDTTILTAISLLDKPPKKHFLWNGRRVYVIRNIYGKHPEDITFTFDLELSAVVENANPTLVDIAVIGEYSDRKKVNFTDEYLNFIGQFPDWADVALLVGAYDSWII